MFTQKMTFMITRSTLIRLENEKKYESINFFQFDPLRTNRDETEFSKNSFNADIVDGCWVH